VQGTGFFCKDASVGSSPTFSTGTNRSSAKRTAILLVAVSGVVHRSRLPSPPTQKEDIAGQPVSPTGDGSTESDQRDPAISLSTTAL
jgi:hypothetical protein